MRNLITCLVVCVLSTAAFADVWTVDDDGKADFDNIQAAVDAASDGDEIVVMPGTYTSTKAEVVDMLGKEVWLHSSQGQEVTIIDGEGMHRGILCNSNETSKTIIEGFTITGGYAGSTPGGGMYNQHSDPTIMNCTFASNNTTGMYNDYSDSTITNCTFTNNTGYRGGGVRWRGGNGTLTNCTFTDNSVSWSGGGMCSEVNITTTLLTNCTFTGNHADEFGGGIDISSSEMTITNTTVCGNIPDQVNGGWTDGGENTIAFLCPDPDGACCTQNSIVCAVSTELICLQFGGQWLGEGTTCDDNSCPTSCPGDINGDGQVNVNDLIILIAYWGVCP